MNVDSSKPNQSTALVASQPATLLQWVVPGVDEGDQQTLAWLRARDAWQDSKRRRSGSQQTVRAYQHDWNEFFQFAGKAPWNISSRDAEEWLHSLHATLKETSINRKLAALSSFYEFVIDLFTFVGKDGVERSIFIDAGGNPRPNPFRKPARFKVDTYNHSDPMSADTVRKCLKAINPHTLLGARDFALIVTYVYTGRRSTEIANLRWGDIEVDQERYYYDWHGKAGSGRVDELPPPAYHAIVHFLKLTGRCETIRTTDYVFQPVFGDRAGRLPNVRATGRGAPSGNRPISSSMINRIVKRRFVAVGVAPALIHTHTLRHTAAHLRYRDGQGQDILEISKFLAHSSIAVTQVYLSQMHKPVDAGWTEVEQSLIF